MELIGSATWKESPDRQRRANRETSEFQFRIICATTLYPRMKNTFVTISSAGPKRDLSKGTREQPLWDEHAAFIDQLVADGFVLMGGPFVDEGGSMLIVNADDEVEVREKLKHDPWMKHGVLQLEGVKRWQIFIDVRK
jgi:uncharacterized protein YciI